VKMFYYSFDLQRGYRLIFCSEFLKLLNCRNGYESWTISYSDGYEHSFNLKSGRNLWRWPKFHHLDLNNSTFGSGGAAQAMDDVSRKETRAK
jgi:hypothetical protein